MSKLNDEMDSVKENHQSLPRRRKSVVPKAASIPLEDPTLQYDPDFKDNYLPLQRRKSVLRTHEIENKQLPSQRRKSVVPKPALTLHHEDPALQQDPDLKDSNPLLQNKKSTLKTHEIEKKPSQRRKSVVPKTALTLHHEDSTLQQDPDLKDNNPLLQNTLSTLKTHEIEAKPSRRRKSVVPKAASTFHHENPTLQQDPDVKGDNIPTQKRKSILKTHEIENKPLPSQRRKSVAPKTAFTLFAENPVIQSHELEENRPPSRRRKSIAPKVASTFDTDELVPHYELEKNHSSLPRKRKSVVPKAVSNPHPNDSLSKQRQEFEEELLSYSGNDPLSVWYKYIKWVEQNFIKGGKDGQIEQVMERCLSALKTNKLYYNDARFIEIWLKFASISKNSVKIYHYMYEKGVGYDSAGFFIAWARKLEEEGNMIKASEVLQEGIQRKSEPIKAIQSYWADFKVRASSIVMVDSKQNEVKFKDNSSKNDFIQEKKSISNQSQTIKSKTPAVVDEQQLLPKSSFSSSASVENPGPLKTISSFAPLYSDNRNFRQSCFWDTRLSIMPRVSNALEVQVDCENPPIALFEPPDPMKVPMYDKSKVYAGAQEVSLEEIRAAAWFRVQKTIDYKKIISEQKKCIAEHLETIKALREEIKFLKEEYCRGEHIQIQDKKNTTLKNGKDQFVVESFQQSRSNTRNKTDSQDPVAQNNSVSQTTVSRKPLSQKDIKNKSVERVLGTILEKGESSYRSSSGSTASVNSPCHQENNTHNNFGKENDTCKNSQMLNKNKVPSNVSEKIIKSKTLTLTENTELSCTDVDPFNEQLNKTLLDSLKLPCEYYGNIQTSSQAIKVLQEECVIQVADVMYVIESPIAAGSFGKVFAAVKQCSNSNTSASKVALKVCKKTSFWEIYVCITLHRRLEEIESTPDVCSSIMKVTSAHKYSNAIVFTNEYSQRGTLVDLVNFYKLNNNTTCVPELLTMYITYEMLQIMSKIHECNIIHADVKPDNVLIRDNISKHDILSSLSQKTLLVKFIDFGRAIDLTLFEKGTCFTTALKKDPCIEMIEKKPWVFQYDWFGVLNCVHALLFSDYMKVKKQTNGRWGIEKRFRRYWDQDLWVPLFDELLNIPSCYKEPNIKPYISHIETKLRQNEHNFKI